MKINLPDSVSRKVAMTVLKTKKHSPTILFAAGVIGMGATVVSACRATLKVEAVLDEHEKKMLDIKTVEHATYSDSDRKRDMTVLYVRTCGQLTRLYAPSVALGFLSVAALTGSHRILTSRNAGLSAAYAALDKGFKEYRSRVVDEYGEDKDREFRFGVEEREVTIQDKNGPKKVKEKRAKTGDRLSVYARFFDENNVNWAQGNPEYRMAFLKLQQNWANDRLRSQGHLFLNELYEELGFEHTPAGSQVGWLYNHPEAKDEIVDFGLWSDENMQATIDFLSGFENGIWVDFNVDGEIWRNI